MRSPYPSYLVFATAAAALCLAAVPAPVAGAAAVRVDRPFVLVADRGDATSWRLLPGAAGAITAEATWSGGASLALILNGPGQTGYFAREDGTSPLVLRFRLTPELLRRKAARPPSTPMAPRARSSATRSRAPACRHRPATRLSTAS